MLWVKWLYIWVKQNCYEIKINNLACTRSCLTNLTSSFWPVDMMKPGHSKPFMISHIMINQLYHIVSNTDKKELKLSYRLEIWYWNSKIIISSRKMILKLKNYHIVSKNDIESSKIIILSQKRYVNWKQYHIISRMISKF